MPNDDFDDAFDAATAELADGTAEPTTPMGRNATVHTGDEEAVETGESGNTPDETGATPDDDLADDDTSTPEVFDWAEHKEKLVTVKVDGQEVQVPLADALGGFMRQQDYTRKTQELAEERKLAAWGREFQTAIKTDPVGTLRALQQALGLETDHEPDPFEDLDPELQPLAAQLQAQQAQMAQIQQMMARQQEQQVFDQVKAEVASVRSQFPDFDATKVLPIAAERGLSIMDAYKLVKADEFLAEGKRTAAAAAKAEQAAADAAKKRAAAERIARGGSASGQPSPAMPDFDDFGDMLMYGLENS